MGLVRLRIRNGYILLKQIEYGRDTNPNKVLELYLSIRTFLSNSRQNVKLVKKYVELAMSLHQNEEALKYSLLLLAYERKINPQNYAEIGRILNDISVMYHRLGQPQKAREYALSSQEMAQKVIEALP